MPFRIHFLSPLMGARTWKILGTKRVKFWHNFGDVMCMDIRHRTGCRRSPVRTLPSWPPDAHTCWWRPCQCGVPVPHRTAGGPWPGSWDAVPAGTASRRHGLHVGYSSIKATMTLPVKIRLFEDTTSSKILVLGSTSLASSSFKPDSECQPQVAM